MSGKLSRSEQREQILQLVYEKSFHDEPVNELLELANIARDYVPTGFVSDELEGIENNIEKIDGEIAKNCKNWAFSRIPRVPLCIMRIAVYELMFCDDIDTAVAINEAVELAKKYASDDDKAYINGVLGAISRDLQK
ncbi:MAG: transcription antitermination factor NusB [Acutalibacteraceae bacterium]|nr:transcription antitermination factor NusB [Acutalibacteraceae bacterium]